MSERIKQMYKSAGVKAPDGKGIHTIQFHRRAIAIKIANKSYSMQRCYALAMSQIGREGAVKKAHRQPAKRQTTKKK